MQKNIKCVIIIGLNSTWGINMDNELLDLYNMVKKLNDDKKSNTDFYNDDEEIELNYQEGIIEKLENLTENLLNNIYIDEFKEFYGILSMCPEYRIRNPGDMPVPLFQMLL